MKRISLETAAIKFSDDNLAHPRIYELPPTEGRQVLEDVQSGEVDQSSVTIEDQIVDTGKWGKINVRYIRPVDTDLATLPVIYYIHGAGWVFGSAKTHLKLTIELATQTQSVVVFPEYSRSPEAKFPTALEQNYAVLQQLQDVAQTRRLDLANLSVAGDSVGGNMATVMTLLTKTRHGLPIKKQLLFYPVTDMNFDTASYKEFAENYYLTREGMQWFWQQYLEKKDDAKDINATPLNASVAELQGLPAALIITAQADVLRDEGEAYAAKLRAANVPVTQVRMQAIIHDFVMLNILDETNATRGAMTLAINWLKE